MKFFKVLSLLAILSMSPQIFANSEDPEVIQDLDLNRYMGLWYEIGHSPNFFQGLCERSTAEYSLEASGEVKVLNTCYRNDSVFSTIKGTATAPDRAEPAKLVVDFGFFRKGDYWIIDLEPNYEWAVVSGPKKSSLFILARKAPMAPEVLEGILAKLKEQGFETDKIIFDKY